MREEAQMKELHKCSKCGGKPYPHRLATGKHVYVSCSVCRFSTPDCESLDEAVEEWNRSNGEVGK